MTTDEPARLHRLFQRLGEVFGHDDASLLMSYLPPGGWGDIRTQQAALHHSLEAFSARVDHRFDEVAEHAAELRQHMRMVDRQLAYLDLRFDDTSHRIAGSERRAVATFDHIGQHVDDAVQRSTRQLVTTLTWAHVGQIVALIVIAALLITQP
jgi:hypothetical protein